MRDSTKKIGDFGEDLAVDFLKKHGYKILKRNYRNRFGEIDIIAREKNVVCFIEVKTRQSLSFGTPFDAVDGRKKEKLNLVASDYLYRQGKDNAEARFDVVAVSRKTNGTSEIIILKDAFST